MAYARVNWNSTTTYVSAENLNVMDKGIKDLDTNIGEVTSLETTAKTVVPAINELKVGLKDVNNNLSHLNWVKIGHSSSTDGEVITSTFEISKYKEVYIAITNSSGELLSSSVCPTVLLTSLGTIYTVYANSTSWGKAVFSTDKGTVTLTQFNASYVFMFAR